MFVDGGVVDDWGREFAGTDAIGGWSDREFIGKHVSLKIDAIQQQRDLIVVTADVGMAWCSARGRLAAGHPR